MKSIQVCLFAALAVLMSQLALASDEDLLRAATRGDVAGIQAALKDGTNVNARLAAGKTALIVAAENGREPAVAALMEAGADLYVLDSSNWDALAHAAEGGHLSTVRLLLRQGYNPSANNWRALAIMRNQSSGGGRGRENRAPPVQEAQRILEQLYQSNPGPIGGLPASTGAAAARGMPAQAPRVAVAAQTLGPVSIDTAGRKISADVFQAAALRALQKRGWKIIKVESDRVAGSLLKNREYRAVITLKPELVQINFLEGYGDSQNAWLLNLKQDVEGDLDNPAIAIVLDTPRPVLQGKTYKFVQFSVDAPSRVKQITGYDLTSKAMIDEFKANLENRAMFEIVEEDRVAAVSAQTLEVLLVIDELEYKHGAKRALGVLGGKAVLRASMAVKDKATGALLLSTSTGEASKRMAAMFGDVTSDQVRTVAGFFVDRLSELKPSSSAKAVQ